jgi:hypothetical protein
MKIRYIIWTLLLFCAEFSFAQHVKFTAAVSKNEVGTGEQFEVTFELNGNGEQFSPPVFTGFQVTGGPNISQSMTIVNGNTTVSNTYSFDLVPVKEGEFTIGAASVTVNGRRLTTNPIKIKVVKGRAVTPGAGQQNAPDQTVNTGGSTDLSKLLFFKAVADKTKVYEGEQITVSYRIYTRVNLVNVQIDKLPDLNGFYSEDVKTLQQQWNWHTEQFKGELYNVADIKQTILYPQHSGDLVIDPLAMTFVVRIADEMDQFFGSYKDVTDKVKSAPLTIHVKPLPVAGKPDGFSGAVGNFKINTQLDKKEVKANEPVNYTIKVSGSGNIKLLKAPVPDIPADFEKYDPKVSDSLKTEPTGISGSRSYGYLLIPRHQGDYTINPVKFSYFNPETGSYRTLTTPPFRMKVEKGTAQQNVTSFAGTDKQEVKLLDKDIRYIKSDLELTKNNDVFYGSVSYYLLLLAGPLLCIIAYYYRSRQRKYNSDQIRVKSRRAGKMAAKHLADAQKQLLANHKTAFYDAVFRGLYGYLGDKLNITAAELNKESIATALTARNIGQPLTGQLLDTLDLCEMARYSPVTSASEQEIFEKAKNIINEIESKI